MDAAAHASRWGRSKPRPHVGRGLAVSHRHIGIGDANAQISVEGDGTVTLLTAAPDTGTGSHTVLRQIAAETLSLPIEQVRVQVATTDAFEADSGAGGSRVTHVAGQATYQAAQELKGLILEVAAQLLGCQPQEVTLSGGRCATADREPSLLLADGGAGGPGQRAPSVRPEGLSRRGLSAYDRLYRPGC